jgi:acetolactate synthase I/II/III large subunit
LSLHFTDKSIRFKEWLSICSEIKTKLANQDIREPNIIIDKISRVIPDYLVITTDVGQNQVWIAQSFVNKGNQQILFSGGHGAMGYSLPAAIGAYYASKKTVVCFTGDGGFQMNIQELQFIAREHLPIKIVILNNSALGMIRHFQEMYLESNYTQTVGSKGYTTPDFGAVAKAYGLDYTLITDVNQVSDSLFEGSNPIVIEVELCGETYVFPKLEFGKPNQDQEPLIDRELYDYLMRI